MTKEQFFHRETEQLLSLLDRAAHLAGASRGQTFEDFLQLTVCALSGGEMEAAYLQTVQRYTEGPQGKRAIDTLTALLASLIQIMDETRADILGDLFQGAVSNGERGQFMTPDCISDLMAQLVSADETTPDARVSDCCCGSGRLLLAAAKVNRNRLFVGQDIDLRCVRMTAINLALHNLYGYVLWGNTLKLEQKLLYQTGFNGKGVIREVPFAQPAPPQQGPEPRLPSAAPALSAPPPLPTKATQRTLFDCE